MANDIIDAGNGIMVEVAAPKKAQKTTKKVPTAKPVKATKAKVEKKAPPKKKGKAADGTLRGVAKPANWVPEVKMSSYADYGLRKPQARLLTSLSTARGPMSRRALSEKSGVEYAWLCNWIGQPDAAARKAREDRWGFTSLLTLKFVTTKVLDVAGAKEQVYEITASGRTALAKYEKAQKEKAAEAKKAKKAK